MKLGNATKYRLIEYVLESYEIGLPLQHIHKLTGGSECLHFCSEEWSDDTEEAYLTFGINLRIFLRPTGIVYTYSNYNYKHRKGEKLELPTHLFNYLNKLSVKYYNSEITRIGVDL